MRIVGEVREVQRRSGTKEREDGSKRDWSMVVVRVLEGKAELHELVLPDTFRVPSEGDTVEYEVSVYVRQGRLAVRLLNDLTEKKAV